MMDQDGENQNIKTCGLCKSGWKNLDDFLRDDRVVFIGYQPSFSHSEKGRFLFNHDQEDCGTTFSIEVWKFKTLLNREVDFLPFKGGEDPDCAHRCGRKNDLENCPAKNCPGAVIRELMQVIKQYVRTPSGVLSADEIDRMIEEAGSKKPEA